MKEFEKLIENLDKLITDTYYKSVDGSASAGIENGAYRNVKKIVNELAEEYQKVYEEKLSEEWITGFAIGATDGWIPCSERLPKSGVEDWVLVQIEETDSGFRWIPRIAELRRDMWYLIDTEYPLENTFKVAAWQPLPAPYKEGK